jgi:hypothetical protein
MTPPPTAAPTDADLLETVSSLVGAAVRDQLWLFPLDAEGVPLHVVVPIEGVPFDADAMPRLAEVVSDMGAAGGWASVVLVWERPGAAWPTRREAAAIAALEAALTLPVRARLLSYDGGVRRLPGGTAA